MSGVKAHSIKSDKTWMSGCKCNRHSQTGTSYQGHRTVWPHRLRFITKHLMYRTERTSSSLWYQMPPIPPTHGLPVSTVHGGHNGPAVKIQDGHWRLSIHLRYCLIKTLKEGIGVHLFYLCHVSWKWQKWCTRLELKEKATERSRNYMLDKGSRCSYKKPK